MDNDISITNEMQVIPSSGGKISFEPQVYDALIEQIRRDAFAKGCKQKLDFELKKKARRAYMEEKGESIKAQYNLYYKETAYLIPKRARSAYRGILIALAKTNGKHRGLRQDSQARKLGVGIRTLRRYHNDIRNAGLLLSIQKVYRDKNGHARKGCLIWYHPDEIRKMINLPEGLTGKLPEGCKALSTGQTPPFSGGQNGRPLLYSFDTTIFQPDEGTVGTRREGNPTNSNEYQKTEESINHNNHISDNITLVTKHEDSLAKEELSRDWDTPSENNTTSIPGQGDKEDKLCKKGNGGKNTTIVKKKMPRSESGIPSSVTHVRESRQEMNTSLPCIGLRISRELRRSTCSPTSTYTTPTSNPNSFPGQVKKETPPCKNVMTILENGSTVMRENTSSDDLERYSRKDSQRNIGHHSLSSYYSQHCSQLTKQESIPTFSPAHTRAAIWMAPHSWITPIKLIEYKSCASKYQQRKHTKRGLCDGEELPENTRNLIHILKNGCVTHLCQGGFTRASPEIPAQSCQDGESSSSYKPISAPESSGGYDDYSNLPKVPEIDVWEPWPPIHTPVEHDEYADFEGDESC